VPVRQGDPGVVTRVRPGAAGAHGRGARAADFARGRGAQSVPPCAPAHPDHPRWRASGGVEAHAGHTCQLYWGEAASQPPCVPRPPIAAAPLQGARRWAAAFHYATTLWDPTPLRRVPKNTGTGSTSCLGIRHAVTWWLWRRVGHQVASWRRMASSRKPNRWPSGFGAPGPGESDSASGGSVPSDFFSFSASRRVRVGWLGRLQAPSIATGRAARFIPGPSRVGRPCAPRRPHNGPH
jgi:hypothetical protein